jgi:hypothetical protein
MRTWLPVASLGEYSEESLDRARRSLASDQEEVETGYECKVQRVSSSRSRASSF